jgi:hypothetical protein
MALQSLQILYIFVLRAEITTIFDPNVVAISAQYKSIQNLQTLQGHIFCISQLANFAILLILVCSFYRSVVIYLHFLA